MKFESKLNPMTISIFVHIVDSIMVKRKNSRIPEGLNCEFKLNNKKESVYWIDIKKQRNNEIELKWWNELKKSLG